QFDPSGEVPSNQQPYTIQTNVEYQQPPRAVRTRENELDASVNKPNGGHHQQGTKPPAHQSANDAHDAQRYLMAINVRFS
ncbi:MAG: hypothetical protein KGJ00_24025, partial [Bradyrhizobium sp.]|nr:hypothetical protein [Bradyrhizobium sp.]